MQITLLRGGPLDILGGGVADPKKKIHARSWTRKKKYCKHLGKEKKFVQLHEKSK